MAELKQKEEESLVDKKIQSRIKQLGKSIYVTMVKNKYIVKGYECRLPRLLTQQGLTTIERVDDAG